jgi:hypothetical protein
MMTQRKKTLLSPQQVTALRGLRLPMQVVSRLRKAGIYCEAAVSIEYRQATKKYVLRGRESGGATAQVGAYCCFVDPSGNAFSWLERVSSVGRNGIHAIVVEPELVRIHACRDEHTYALLITRHQLRARDDRKRPALENTILFHGVYGTLALELWGKDRQLSGPGLPVFHTKGGERLLLPAGFEQAVHKVIAATNCIGCSHSHLAERPTPPGIASTESNDSFDVKRETTAANGGDPCPLNE